MNEKPTQEEAVLESKRGLADEIKQTYHEDANRCYQCLKCSAGCPMTFAMDYLPSQIMRLVQLGQEDLLLTSKTIWVCLTCNTCSIRCPNDIDIALVIDSLRERSLQKGYLPAVEDAALFHKSFVENIKRRGRLFEGEMGLYMLKTGKLIENSGMLINMVLKGRTSILPEGVENKAAFKEICRRVEERDRGGKK